MYIYILLILFIAILAISYLLFKKEIMQPAVVFCTAYAASVLCATLNINNWNINLSPQAFWVLLLGEIEFIIISYIVYKVFEKKKGKTLESNLKKSEIKISKLFIILLVIYNVIVLGLLLKSVTNIASQFGEYNNFSQALTIYKDHTSYSKDAELPNYLTILMKPIISMAYIAIFVFLNNIIYGKGKIQTRILKNSYYLIFPILYFVQRFMESNRGSILNFCVGALAMAVILWSIKYDWKRHIKLRTIAIMVIVACVVLILFYFSASLVGRINNKKIFDYITYYVGGSIECFNRWIQEPTKPDVVQGEYTFASTINDLNKLRITDYKLNNSGYSKFIYNGDTAIGNIYTAYRSWMHDWGIAGVIVLQAILAIVINIVYNKIKYSKKYTDYIVIFYGYIIYVIFMHPIDSYFYLEFFTIANIAVLVAMGVLYYVLTNLKVEINLKETKKVEISYKGKEIKWKKN